MIYGVGVCPAGRQICFCLGSMSLLCGLSVLGVSVDIGACTELNSTHLHIMYIGFSGVGPFFFYHLGALPPPVVVF